MTELFQQAIRLNNEGVNALVERNETMAVECLTKSIKILKSELCKPSTGTSSKDKDYFLADASESSEDTTLTVELPELQQEEQTFMFNQALTLSGPRSEDESDPSDDDLHVSTATVVFNLALAHHRHGMNTGRGDLLLKADKLYSMVLKLLAEDHHYTSQSSIITKLASINNLAQLRFDAGDFEKAREGLGHLSHGFRVTSLTFLQGTDMKDLLMNVLLLTPPKAAPAA